MKLYQISGLPIAVVAVAFFLSPCPGGQIPRGHKKIFKESPAVRPFFDSAYSYAVFQVVGKVGFVVGGAYGTGRVHRNGVATGTAWMVKATIGLQAGGQAFSEIIFFPGQTRP